MPNIFMRQRRSDNAYLDELEALAKRKIYSFYNVTRLPLTIKTECDYLERNRVKQFYFGESEIVPAIPIAIDQKEEIILNSFSSRFVKRFCDIVGSVIGLIMTFPFWLVIPILIKLDSRGPVFYSHIRVGRNRRGSRRRTIPQMGAGNSRRRERRRERLFGETFRIIKFRTMVDQAERDSGPVWAAKNDMRITRVGSILRKLRLDEVPQFLNVFMGDMSLVGPRPERPLFVRELAHELENYNLRLQVKPGITGLAQVRGTYDSSMATVARKLKFDLDYINNWSLWLDMKILFQTVYVVLSGRGAQ